MARAAPMSPEDRRAQLLRAARRVFAERGYHSAGVSHIIREAGVARGTFYNYFESKGAIFHAVLEELTGELAGAADRIDITRPIAPQAHAIVHDIICAVMQPDVVRLLFSEAVGTEEGDAALRAFYDHAEERLVGTLKIGAGLGIVRNGDLRLTARCMLGMVKEPVFVATLRGEALRPEPLIAEFTAFLTQGVLQLSLDGSAD